MAKSRAEYMKKRREGKKQFNVLLDKELVDGLDKILEKKKVTKTEWTETKIKEELDKDEK